MKNIYGTELPILAKNLIYFFNCLTKHLLRSHPTVLDELPSIILLAMYCALWLNDETPSTLSTRILHRYISSLS